MITMVIRDLAHVQMVKRSLLEIRIETRVIDLLYSYT